MILPFEFEGEVVRGKGLGRTIGFPTANLSISHAITSPYGVYSARVFVCQKWYNGIVNIGGHPTFPEGPPAIEVHIIGQFDDLYGKTMNVQLIKYLRKESKFQSIDALRKQICKDLQHIKTSDENMNS